ncbi:hypothetical protein QTP86_007825 [Hemibagrus guttatus]|nr:hypothetical protein QTP86_007825 [Hemibagrus guttatus]
MSTPQLHRLNFFSQMPLVSPWLVFKVWGREASMLVEEIIEVRPSWNRALNAVPFLSAKECEILQRSLLLNFDPWCNPSSCTDKSHLPTGYSKTSRICPMKYVKEVLTCGSLSHTAEAQSRALLVSSERRNVPLIISSRTRESLASNTSSIVESNRRQNPALSPGHMGSSLIGAPFSFRSVAEAPSTQAEKLQKPNNCLASITSV